MATTPTSYGSTTSTGGGSPDLAADANALLDEAKSAAGKVVDEAKGQAANLTEMAKEQVASLTDRAKEELGSATDKAKSLAADQKDVIADQVDGVVSAISKAASDLEQSNGPTAHYARMIADNAEKLSSTIRDNDVDQLLGMAQDFGRRQPVAFMGAAALLGFAASRFLMASAKRREPQYAGNSASGYQDYAGQPSGSYGSTNYGAGGNSGNYGTGSSSSTNYGTGTSGSTNYGTGTSGSTNYGTGTGSTSSTSYGTSGNGASSSTSGTNTGTGSTKSGTSTGTTKSGSTNSGGY